MYSGLVRTSNDVVRAPIEEVTKVPKPQRVGEFLEPKEKAAPVPKETPVSSLIWLWLLEKRKPMPLRAVTSAFDYHSNVRSTLKSLLDSNCIKKDDLGTHYLVDTECAIPRGLTLADVMAAAA